VPRRRDRRRADAPRADAGGHARGTERGAAPLSSLPSQQSDPLPRTPLAMAVGAFLGALWAALTAMVLPLAAAGALPLSIAGEPIPARGWMRVAGPPVIAAALVMVAFAAGVAGRRAWTRPMGPLLGAGIALYSATLGLAGAVPPAVAARAALEGILLAAAAFWYFYRKPSVAAYYVSCAATGRRLESRW